MEILSEYENHNNPVMGENAVLLIGVCKDDALNPWQDTAIALAAAELILQAEGVGTCWGGYLTRFVNAIPKMPEPAGHFRRQQCVRFTDVGISGRSAVPENSRQAGKAEVTRF